MSGRHQDNDDDDDEFLLTPRARNRFRPGFDRNPQHGFDRYGHPSQHRQPERPYSQWPHGSNFYNQRPYESHCSQQPRGRFHETHYSQRSYESQYSHQRSYQNSYSQFRTHDFGEHTPHGPSGVSHYSQLRPEVYNKYPGNRQGDTYNHWQSHPASKATTTMRQPHWLNTSPSKKDCIGDSSDKHFNRVNSQQDPYRERKLNEKKSVLTENLQQRNSEKTHFGSKNKKEYTDGHEKSGKEEADREHLEKAESESCSLDKETQGSKKNNGKEGNPFDTDKLLNKTEHKKVNSAGCVKNDQVSFAKGRFLHTNEKKCAKDSNGSLEGKSTLKGDKKDTLSNNGVSNSRKPSGDRVHEKHYQKGFLNCKSEKTVGHSTKDKPKEGTKNKSDMRTIKNVSGLKSKSQKIVHSKTVCTNTSDKNVQIPKPHTVSQQYHTEKFEDKAETAKQVVSRQTSSSSNVSVECDRTTLSRSGYTSSERSERKSSSEMSALDFASNIFKGITKKSHEKASKTDSKVSVEQKDISLKGLEEKTALKQAASNNKTKQKKVLEKIYDCESDSDSELDKFKNILTKVHDSKWKTKPLHIDSKMSSSQSLKSTDSAASISILEPKEENPWLSKRVYKKYGVKNVEYRMKKLFFKGVHIKQPTVKITKQDTQNIIWHRKALKRKSAKRNKTTFKRIKVTKLSSSDSNIEDIDVEPMSPFNSFIEEIKSESPTHLSKTNTQEFDWIVPDSCEESDWSSNSSKKRKSLFQIQIPKKRKQNEKDSVSHLSKKWQKYSVEERKSSLKDGKTKKDNSVECQKAKSNSLSFNSKSSNSIDHPVSTSRKGKATCNSAGDKETQSTDLRETYVTNRKVTESVNENSGSDMPGHQETEITYIAKGKEIEKNSKEKKTETKNTCASFQSSLKTDLKNSREGKAKRKHVCNSSAKTKFLHIKNDIIKKDKVNRKESTTPLSNNDFETQHTILQETHSTNKLVMESDITNSDMLGNQVKDTSSNAKSHEIIEIVSGEKKMSLGTSFEISLKTDLKNSKDGRKGQTAFCNNDAETKSLHIKNDIVKKIAVTDSDSTNADSVDSIMTVSSSESEVKPCRVEIAEIDDQLEEEKKKKTDDTKTSSDKIDDQLEDEKNKNTDDSKTGSDLLYDTDDIAEIPETQISSYRISSPEHVPVLQTSEQDADNCYTPCSDLKQDTKVSANSDPISNKLSVRKTENQKLIMQSLRAFQCKRKTLQQSQKSKKKLKPKNMKKDLNGAAMLWDSDETGGDGDIEDNNLFESLSETENSDIEYGNNKHVEFVEKATSSHKAFEGHGKKVQGESDDSSDIRFCSMSDNENSDSSFGSEFQKARDLDRSVESIRPMLPITQDDKKLRICKNELDLQNSEELVIGDQSITSDNQIRISHHGLIKGQRTLVGVKDSVDQNENLLNVRAEPVKIKEEPGNIIGEPVKLKEESGNKNDEPVKIKEDLDNVKDEFVKINMTAQRVKIKEEFDNMKDEPIKIKEEPAWSKFTYTQEPDTIFLSDSDDDAAEIVLSQNEINVVQIGSDSDDEFPFSSQKRYVSSPDNEIQDPEYWDFFSSSENFSNSENEAVDKSKDIKLENIKSEITDDFEDDFPLQQTSSLNSDVKDENIVTSDIVDPATNFVNRRVKQECKHVSGKSEIKNSSELEKITTAEISGLENKEECFSFSEFSDDDLDYSEIDCHDNDSDDGAVLEQEVKLQKHRFSSPIEAYSKKSDNLPGTSLNQASTDVDSFDPYSVATQDTALPSYNERVKSLLAVVSKAKSEPVPNQDRKRDGECPDDSVTRQGDKYFFESEDEVRLKKITVQDVDMNFHKSSDDNCLQADMQVDSPFKSCNLIQGEKTKIISKVPPDDLNDTNSLSDSSLVDAADKQIHLYMQSKNKLQKRRPSRFAEGLEIKYMEGIFSDEEGESNQAAGSLYSKVMAPALSANERSIKTTNKLDDRNSKNACYDNMTQVDILSDNRSPLTEPADTRNTSRDPYMALTQIETVMFSDGEDILNYLDDKVEILGSDYANSDKEKPSFMEKNEQHVYDEINRKTINIITDTSTDEDWYSKSTQFDKRKESVHPEDENVIGVSNAAYTALTQKSSLTVNDSGDESIHTDTQSQPSSDGEFNRPVKEIGKNVSDIYHMPTQVDMNIKENVLRTDDKSVLSIDSTRSTSDDSDDNDRAYGALTQVDDRSFNDCADSATSDKEDIYANLTQIDYKFGTSAVPGDVLINSCAKKETPYSVATQKETFVISSDEDDQVYLTSTQVNATAKEKVRKQDLENVYEIETQIDDDSSEQFFSAECNNDFYQKEIAVHSPEPKNNLEIFQGDNIDTTSKAHCISGPSILRKLSGEKTVEQENKLEGIKDKLKQSVSERKTIEIPMQKKKSYCEKKLSRQVSHNSTSAGPKPLESRTDLGTNTNFEVAKKGQYTSDFEVPSDNLQTHLNNITFYPASKPEKWLSKGVRKPIKSPKKPSVKRKRRLTDEADSGLRFKKKIEEARRQLADRNYQTIFKPNSIADPQRKQKIDITTASTTELEDVDLPTCSQIVSKGLPVLNPTGMLMKRSKPQHFSSRFSSRAVSLTETMVDSNIPKQITSTNTDSGTTATISDTMKSASARLTDKSRLSATENITLSDSSNNKSKKMKIDKSTKEDVNKLEVERVNSYSKAKKQKLTDLSEDSEHLPKSKLIKPVSSPKDDDVLGRHTHVQKLVKESKSVTNIVIVHTDKGKSLKKSKENLSGKNISGVTEAIQNNADKQTDLEKSSKNNKENLSVKSISGVKDVVKTTTDKHTTLEKKSSKNNKESLFGKSISEVTETVKTNTDKHFIKEKSSQNNKESLSRKQFSGVTDAVTTATDKHTYQYKEKSSKNKKEDLSGKNIPVKTEVVKPSTDTGKPKEILDKMSPAYSKPAWNASWMETHKKAENAMVRKTAKKVTFSEMDRTSNKENPQETSKTSRNQDLQRKPNAKDSRHVQKTSKEPANRVNLMFKTPLQNQDLAKVAATGTPNMHSVSPKPFQVIQNKVPATSSPLNPANQTKGITYKEFLAVMLKWNPVWFEEHAKQLELNRNAEPPPCTNGLPGNPTLYPLPEKYSSFQEYSDNFMVPLLLYETWESTFQTLKERQNRRTVVKHRLCLSAMYDAGDKLNEWVLLGLITEGDRRQGHSVFDGDLLTLNIFGTMLDVNNKPAEKKWVSQIALVEKVIYKDRNVNNLCKYSLELAKLRKPDSLTVKLILKTRRRKFTPDYTILGEVMQIGSVVTTLRQFEALEYLPKNPLCRDILWPTNNETYCDNLAGSLPEIQGDFNPSQLRAITAASSVVSQPSHRPRICLLQGPPGTGKSHTILGIINQILQNKQKKVRICLCAQSHAAVDELIRRLDRQNKLAKHKGVGSAVKLIRIGKPSSVHKDVQYLCLDNLIQRNVQAFERAALEKQLPQSLQVEKATTEKKIKALTTEIKNANELKRKKLEIDLQKLEKQRGHLMKKCKLDTSQLKPDPERERKIKHDLLCNAQVIAGTLSGIGGSVLKQHFEHRDKYRQCFDCLIIDEATQAIELDTLIPLQYGITKLILVGDPEQLPPTVVSQVAIDNKFNLSLFERLNSHFRFSNYNPVIMLDTQYRMDPEICSFPSNYIYDGKLKTDRSIFGRTQCPLVPYLLYDVADGREQMSQCSGSVSNPVEAEFTVRLCKFITTNTSVTAKVIGIIAPYQKQKTLLMQNLQNMGLRDIEVSTVDGFQGREKHVIIMSCVRAKSSTGTIGFVGNRNRMNVSLTRAKYALYVVAHFDSLEKSDEWKALIEDAEKRKKRIPVNVYNLEEGLKMCLKKRPSRPP